MIALLVFKIATLAIVFGRKKLLEAKGPFCNYIIKNPARRSCEMSSIDAKWPETMSVTSKWHTVKDWQNSLEKSSRCFENQPNKICSHSYFGQKNCWTRKVYLGITLSKIQQDVYHLFLPWFQVWGPARKRVPCCRLNFKTFCVCVYKCFMLLLEIKREFFVFVGILEKGDSDAL